MNENLFQKDLEIEGEMKAHYLVVEVIYHGRSLVASEKTIIQKKVAHLVDNLLKNKTSPNLNETKVHVHKKIFLGLPYDKLNPIVLTYFGLCR